jgi:hypothetical protein
MAKDENILKYGHLNPIAKDQFKRRIETNTNDDGLSILRDTAAATLFEQKITIDGEFVGVVMRTISPITTPENDSLSLFQKFWHIVGGTPPVIHKYYVRIPEVHSYLPEPLSSLDPVVELHDIFEFIKTEDGSSLPGNGDLVIVKFYDNNGVKHPTILRKLSETTTGFPFLADLTSGNRFAPDSNPPLVSPSVGDNIGSGEKSNNHVPESVEPSEEFEEDPNKVLRWLPEIRLIREAIKEENSSFDSTFYSDEFVLTMIEKESGGDPWSISGWRRPDFSKKLWKKGGKTWEGDLTLSKAERPTTCCWGVLQQTTLNIQESFEFVANKESHVLKKSMIGFDREDFLSLDQETAGRLSIEVFFRNLHRYRNLHEGDFYLMSNLHNQGPGFAKKVKRYSKANNVSIPDAAYEISVETSKGAAKAEKIRSYVASTTKKMDQWRAKI